MMFEQGVVVSRAVDGRRRPEGKFKMYVRLPRAAREDPLAPHAGHPPRREGRASSYFEIELDRGTPINISRAQIIHRAGDWVPHLELAVEDG